MGVELRKSEDELVTKRVTRPSPTRPVQSLMQSNHTRFAFCLTVAAFSVGANNWWRKRLDQTTTSRCSCHSSLQGVNEADRCAHRGDNAQRQGAKEAEASSCVLDRPGSFLHHCPVLALRHLFFLNAIPSPSVQNRVSWMHQFVRSRSCQTIASISTQRTRRFGDDLHYIMM